MENGIVVVESVSDRVTWQQIEARNWEVSFLENWNVHHLPPHQSGCIVAVESKGIIGVVLAADSFTCHVEQLFPLDGCGGAVVCKIDSDGIFHLQQVGGPQIGDFSSEWMKD